MSHHTHEPPASALASGLNDTDGQKRKFWMPPVTAKVKAAPRTAKWRGTTAIELGRDGTRERIYHLNASETESWTHPYKERCHACGG